MLQGKDDRHDRPQNGSQRVVDGRLFVGGDFLKVLCGIKIDDKGIACIAISINIQVVYFSNEFLVKHIVFSLFLVASTSAKE